MNTVGRPNQRITPLAKRIAAEKGIDIASVQGSGPSGRIYTSDLKNEQAASVFTNDADVISFSNIIAARREAERAAPIAEVSPKSVGFEEPEFLQHEYSVPGAAPEEPAKERMAYEPGAWARDPGAQGFREAVEKERKAYDPGPWARDTGAQSFREATDEDRSTYADGRKAYDPGAWASDTGAQSFREAADEGRKAYEPGTWARDTGAKSFREESDDGRKAYEPGAWPSDQKAQGFPDDEDARVKKPGSWERGNEAYISQADEERRAYEPGAWPSDPKAQGLPDDEDARVKKPGSWERGNEAYISQADEERRAYEPGAWPRDTVAQGFPDDEDARAKKPGSWERGNEAYISQADEERKAYEPEHIYEKETEAPIPQTGDDLKAYILRRQAQEIAGQGMNPMIAAAIEADDHVVGVLRMNDARRAVALQTAQSAMQTAAVTQHMETDVTELVALYNRVNEGRGRPDQIPLTAFFLKALAVCVRDEERFRLRLSDAGDAYLMVEGAHLGLQVDAGDSVATPVVRDVDLKSLDEVAEDIITLTEKAKRASLSVENSRGGIITLLDKSESGVYAFTPLIHQPEAAILGIGSIYKRLEMTERSIENRQYVMQSLTFDHRVLNGTEADRFQRRFKTVLENPQSLIV